MFNPISLYVGLRYLRSKRRNRFISFISLFTILGLLIGTSVLILVLSVMNGFSQEINSRILGAVPHVIMHSPDGLNSWEEYATELKENYEVAAAVPYVSLEGMLAAHGRSSAVLINGVEPRPEQEASIFSDFMQQGSLADLAAGDFSIILGSILASSLGVGVGDELIMVIPQITNSPLGALPRLRRFRVSGIFSLGSEIDANVVLVHIDDASAMKRLGGRVEGLKLRLDDVFAAPLLRYILAEDYFGEFQVSDWSASYGNLFASIRLEKRLVGLLLFLIIAVASFNMVSTLVMLVNDKEGDIAILRTMGASTVTIVGIFIVNGSVAGLIGTSGGVLLGVLLALYISDLVAIIEGFFAVDFLSSETYFIDFLPSQLLLSDVLIVASATLALSMLASIYPALKAANVSPAESLRHE